MTSEQIINMIISIFIIGCVPFFLMGINKDMNKNSEFSKSKTQLLKLLSMGLIGFISVFIGGLLITYKPLYNIVHSYDLQFKIPFIGGIGSLVYFLCLAFIFTFIIAVTGDSSKKNQ